MKCGDCPVAGECPGERTAGILCDRPGYRDHFARSAGVVPRTPDAAIAVAIELCPFRRSSCGCLGKPATCLRAGFPAVLSCLDEIARFPAGCMPPEETTP